MLREELIAFEIIKKKEPSYNNPGFYKDWQNYEGSEESICYEYERFNGQKVSVLNPKIDTLRFTLDTKDKALRKKILEDMSKLGDAWEPSDKSFGEVKYGKYQKRVILKGYPTDVVLFAHNHNIRSQRFLQVCLHASQFTANEIKKLYSLLAEISDGLWSSDYIWSQSKVLRADWRVDFLHINVVEMGMWKLSQTRGAKIFINKGVGVTGAEIDSKWSGQGNKYKKGKHNASKAYYYDKEFQSNLSNGHMTRFEFRTFKEDTSLKDNIMTAGKKSVFKPYEVLDFAAMKPESFRDHEWLSFGDSCMLRMREDAISMLPEMKKQIAQQTLEKVGQEVWRFEKLKIAMKKETARFKL